jgi:hypothetical protein
MAMHDEVIRIATRHRLLISPTNLQPPDWLNHMISRTLGSALILSLASCASTIVPLADDSEVAWVQGAQGSDLDSVIYQGEAAEKAKSPKASRSALIFLIGQRSLDEDYWLPVEDQVSFAVEYTWVPATGHLGFEVGLGASVSVEDALIVSNIWTSPVLPASSTRALASR